MHPILFSVDGLTIYTYGVLLSLGIVLCFWYCQNQSVRIGLSPSHFRNLGILMILTGLVTAKIWLVLSSLGHRRVRLADLTEICLHSGGVFYGGLFGATLAMCLYAHFRKLSILPLCDLFARGLPLGHAIVKLGCLAAGCCYGRPTTRAWGIVYTNPVAHQLAGTPLYIALQPTQLYEAGAELCIFVILASIANRKPTVGSVAAIYLLMYGTARASIEFLRGDPGRVMVFGGLASQFQVVSACIAVLGAFFIIHHNTKPEKILSGQ